ncbi:MAG: DUF374 domain-containing protein [Rickettsiales bacterium]|jgi:lysophospholipid acyltransferase (LPLAT)-like uncharacterized protein|nr:DUF374 domain-containing protein [Rickettsiales bacterium]
MKSFRKIWKSIFEPQMKKAWFQWLVAGLMAFAIWTVYYTSWKRIKNKKIFKTYRNQPAIFVFWHGRSMMLSPIVRRFGIHGYAVASRHSDGRMMAKLQRLFGLKPIFGSTSEGGVSVLRQGVRRLREGNGILAMSPDGPSGPSLRLQDGALYFAKMTGAPIIPVCFSCARPWFQNRWDRYLVATPFTYIRCEVGEPVYVGEKATKEDFEKIRAKLENFMVKQTRNMDARFTQFKVEQDTNSTIYDKKANTSKGRKA